MIIKKVPTSKATAPKSKARNVRALADYIAGPHAGGDGEKVEHRGGLNLLNIDHDGQVDEMIDLAETARRSAQPVKHWIMSWRQGEQPTPAQANEAVAIFLNELGLGRHQVIYALHRDTKNCHLHLAVNRVDPDTERVVTVNNGFDHEIRAPGDRTDRATAGLAARRPGAVCRPGRWPTGARPGAWRARASTIQSGARLRGAGGGTQCSADRARSRGTDHP